MLIRAYAVSGLSRLHKALGDETRLRIVHLLAHRGELCVCDVESVLHVSQSRASRHLGHLKRAGVVEDRRDGAWVFYRVAPRAQPAVRSAIRAIKRGLESDPVAARDLARAETRSRGSACAPIEVAARGGR